MKKSFERFAGSGISIPALLNYANIQNGRRLSIECDPVTKEIRIKAINDLRYRREIAERVLSEWHARARTQFVEVGKTTIAVVSIHGKTKVGVAICDPNDQYDRTVGRAIAFQRATLGHAYDELTGRA